MGRRLLLGTVSALLLGAPAADATNFYCVHQPSESCTTLFPGFSGTDEGADLQKALNSSSESFPNGIVYVGPGTFTHEGGFKYSNATIPTTINGSGIGRTVLQATGPTATSVAFLEGPPDTALTDATLAVTPNVTEFGVVLRGPKPSSEEGAAGARLAVTNAAASTSPVSGAEVMDGGLLFFSTIEGGEGGNAVAINAFTGAATLSDDTLSARTGLVGEASVSAQRLRVEARSSGIYVSGSGSSAFDGLLDVTRESGAFGLAVGDETNAVVRSGTFVNTSGTGTAWEAATNEAGHTSKLTVLDSIQRGFDSPTLCFAVEGKGKPSITLGNDDLHLTGAETCSNGGTFEAGAGDIDADPLFVSPAEGDYHLSFGSPAIDAGGSTCNTLCQHSDLDGLLRPIDGNGDGTATRDMGAFEYGHRPPVAVAGVTGGPAVTGAPVTFSAAGSSDPDPGDRLTYSWAFDDGTSATGQTVAHAFSTPGRHEASLVASDPSGLTADAVASVVVSAAPPTSSGGSRDTTPPRISSLRLSHVRFRVSSSATAVLARTDAPKGTRVGFSLSEPATSVLTIERKTTGIVVGHSCRARRPGHLHGRRCARYVAAGSLTRRGESAGAQNVAFSGRVGRKALSRGSYRLRLVAADVAGNRSAPARTSFTIV